MKIKCLECGKYYKRPATHVRQVHNITAREYKEIHGLDVKKGIMSEEDRQIMREHTLTNGTSKNLQQGAKYRFRKDHHRNYKRSEQTQARLKKHWLNVANLKGRAVSIPKIIIHCAECRKEKLIYPRYKKEKNYCSTLCHNRGILKKRGLIFNSKQSN